MIQLTSGNYNPHFYILQVFSSWQGSSGNEAPNNKKMAPGVLSTGAIVAYRKECFVHTDSGIGSSCDIERIRYLLLLNHPFPSRTPKHTMSKDSHFVYTPAILPIKFREHPHGISSTSTKMATKMFR